MRSSDRQAAGSAPDHCGPSSDRMTRQCSISGTVVGWSVARMDFVKCSIGGHANASARERADRARCVHIGRPGRRHLRVVLPCGGDQNAFRGPNRQQPLGRGRRSHCRGFKMEEVAIKGLHCNEVRDRKGEPEQVVLEIRYRRLRVLPPIGKQRVCRNALVDVGLSRCALLRRRGSASQANAFSQGPRGRLSHSKYPAD